MMDVNINVEDTGEGLQKFIDSYNYKKNIYITLTINKIQ